MRDEADVELKDAADAGEVSVSGGEEGVLEEDELSGREAANACVVFVKAELVAMRGWVTVEKEGRWSRTISYVAASACRSGRQEISRSSICERNLSVSPSRFVGW